MKLTEKEINELGPFEPPMPKKLGIVWRNDKRRMAFESFAKNVSLLDAFPDEVRSILGSLFACERRNISTFLVLRNSLAGNAVIL
ncbi:hypothetical protein [Leptolyngbya sp. 7M]|uniref:hypothetical protein n=1 Tax=Leptolyngbya sp. 7M TaxID=2812896 RepID=UPI001B8AE279|nr:hypothetical protein [Leptolyngbya sp. 7M]QYO64228.1 hypothetical protein JVX88_31595 [Leptolyngbya sp. 7M]